MTEYNNNSPLWKIDGEENWRNGNTQIKLSPNTYKVVFRDIEGYQTPEPQFVNVFANENTSITANYVYIGDVSNQSSIPFENMLHFVAKEKDSTISLTFDTISGTTGYNWCMDLWYSVDNCKTWEDAGYLLTKRIVLDDIGDSVYFKGKNKRTEAMIGCVLRFKMTGKIEAYGSVMSLIDETGCTTSLKNYDQYTFRGLFKNCTALVKAPKLTATVLKHSCYQEMFEGCTSLEEPPELPATDLAIRCYYGMFKGCSSLKHTTVLPASVMDEGCYQYMFSGCSSITMPPTLASMELEGYCYSRMFENCTSLIEMPDLPATIVKEGCYDTMFSGCTSLTSIKNLPCEDLRTKAYYRMFLGCTGLTEVNLPVTSLSVESCLEMFKDCTNFNKITINFEHWLDGDNATEDWLKDVSSEGEFVAPEGLEEIRDVSHIPSGWTLTRKSDD